MLNLVRSRATNSFPLTRKSKVRDDRMKLDKVTIATILALVVLVALGSLIYKPKFDNPKTVVIGEQLIKNSKIMFKPGQQYTYQYDMNGTFLNLTFNVIEGNGCTGIMLYGGNASGACVDDYGVERNGSDTGYADGSIFFFQPWMLALKDGWQWNTSTYLEYGDTKSMVDSTEYRVIRQEEFAGQQCFVVEIKDESGITEYDWISQKDRTVVKIESNGYKLERVG